MVVVVAMEAVAMAASSLISFLEFPLVHEKKQNVDHILINAISDRNVFPNFRNNHLWLGEKN